MSQLVFVYGRLRKGESNHRLLSHEKCMAAQAWTRGELFDTGYGYPTMSISDSSCTYGELYEVDENTLQRLDQLEGYEGDGHSNLYNRVTQEVMTDVGTYQAFVYVTSDLLSSQNQPIPSGDWRVYRKLATQETLLYFAYGSCMDTKRFKDRGVDHYFCDVIGKGELADYKIGFTRHASDGGRADIIEEKGECVEGKVYRIPYDALSYLDWREGVLKGCYRPIFIEVIINGVLHKDVLSFTVINKKENIAPPAKYEKELWRGGREIFSPAYANQLKELIESLQVKKVAQ